MENTFDLLRPAIRPVKVSRAQSPESSDTAQEGSQSRTAATSKCLSQPLSAAAAVVGEACFSQARTFLRWKFEWVNTPKAVADLSQVDYGWRSFFFRQEWLFINSYGHVELRFQQLLEGDQDGHFHHTTKGAPELFIAFSPTSVH